MTELQQEVTEWAEATFPGSTVQAKILHLWEELEEAFERANSKADYKTCEEIADAGLITLHLASSLGVELPAATPRFAAEVRNKLDICKTRKWGAPDENGVVRHVKEG